jgi:hypothetical protein
MSTWTHLTFVCVFGSFCGAVLADSSRTEFEQSVIGREWVQRDPETDRYPLSDQCKYLWRNGLQRNQKQLVGLSIDSFSCGKQYLQLFGQITVDGRNKVLDALLLPKLKTGESLMLPGGCQLNGNDDTDFIAIARLGRHETVNWKTGVRAAWIPNPDTGKIEELSTRHVVCGQPTPP